MKSIHSPSGAVSFETGQSPPPGAHGAKTLQAILARALE